VIGAGGLGSVVLPQLVGSGVGTAPEGRIGIIDDDVVELSNLHRQHLHITADLGRLKVDSAAERLRAMDPAVTIVTHPERLTSENALALLADYDVLVDGSDGFATRYLAADAATLRGIPLVWGAVLQFDGQVGTAPVGGPGYRDLFPTPPDPATVLDCATGGVLPAVCGVIGAIMATQVVTLVTGVGESLIGRVTTYDARSGRFRELAYGRDPEAPAVTELIDYEQFCGVALDMRTGVAANDDLAPTTLAELLDGSSTTDAPPLLLDVREPWEHELVALPGSTFIPLGQLPAAIAGLPRDRVIVAYCHHGIRSRHALDLLQAAGFDARHLTGGIDAWSTQVDPTVARY
jgi:adenylyltransferase/sulfurtransferase